MTFPMASSISSPTGSPKKGDENAHTRLRIDVLTIFPQIIDQFCTVGVVGRGRSAGVLDIRAHDLRVATSDPHRSIDDKPFGGGAGMVMMAAPLFGAVAEIDPARPLLLMSPAGKTFDQSMAVELAGAGGFSMLCGRYEGVDQRVGDHLVDEEISVGDVVLAGGEVAAMMIIEATARLVPGVLGNSTSVEDESFTNGLLEHAHYTRPADFQGWAVPEVLRGGDHGLIERWRLASALDRTARLRPDLIVARGGLSDRDRALLVEFGFEAE